MEPAMSMPLIRPLATFSPPAHPRPRRGEGQQIARVVNHVCRSEREKIGAPLPASSGEKVANGRMRGRATGEVRAEFFRSL